MPDTTATERSSPESPLATPQTFLEMQQMESEHLGSLQIGSIAIYRDVVKCRLIDETGQPMGTATVHTADLSDDVIRLLWSVSVAMSEPVARSVRESIAASLDLIVAMGRGNTGVGDD